MLPQSLKQVVDGLGRQIEDVVLSIEGMQEEVFEVLSAQESPLDLVSRGYVLQQVAARLLREKLELCVQL